MAVQPNSSLTDQDLMEQVSKGDEAAFKELYSRYHVPIYNYILRLIHQQTTAEDLLQEVFLAIWQGARNFRGNSSPKTWIFRIAHYQTVSWLRKNTRRNQVIEYPEIFQLSNKIPLPEEALIGRWQTHQILTAIERLSPNHRAVVELTFIHGFAYRQIAEIMDCPVGTVKSRMSYALKYLHSMLSTSDLE